MGADTILAYHTPELLRVLNKKSEYRTAATYIHHGAPDLSDAPKEATLLSPEWLQPEVRPHPLQLHRNVQGADGFGQRLYESAQPKKTPFRSRPSTETRFAFGSGGTSDWNWKPGCSADQLIVAPRDNTASDSGNPGKR